MPLKQGLSFFAVAPLAAAVIPILCAAPRAAEAQKPVVKTPLSTRPEPVVATDEAAFMVKPYVQLGNAPAAVGRTESLAILWHTDDSVEAEWTVQTRSRARSAVALWGKAIKANGKRVAVQGVEPHRVWSATLAGLTPGQTVEYQVLKNSKPVFRATALARKAAGQASRFVVFGDCAAKTEGQRKIAYQTYKLAPDYVFITGDIVYSRGRVSEYRDKYFPVYNAEKADPAVGAPLTRSTLFMATPGNHDTGSDDFGQFPDTMAYFYYWSQPLNGPIKDAANANAPKLKGPEENVAAFKTAAGTAFPRMANFSFDYGDAHWTVLDANTYVDWNDPALRAWLAADLKKASGAKWRFVSFHQPGFNSSKKHFSEQQMRVIAPLLEAGKTDVVFCGHVHNYQRSFPMRFQPAAGVKAKGEVAGNWTLDKAYDGKTRTRPSGVIYIVTGAGGADLYDEEQTAQPESWQGFTNKFISTVHSLTSVDMKSNALTVRQIDENGNVVDAFVITR